ncbi:MAG: hypothetical protein SFY81_00570 [Verrucomicrobiota bacterium]|nr:hypothetical protein [Verrucomicrobiota bacterium]
MSVEVGRTRIELEHSRAEGAYVGRTRLYPDGRDGSDSWRGILWRLGLGYFTCGWGVVWCDGAVRNLVCFLCVAVCLAVSRAEGVRVYFVGNSVTDTVRYGGLAKLAESRGIRMTWGRQMIPGAPLEWLYGHPEEGFTEEPFGGWKKALNEFAWDHVVLQPFDRQLQGKNEKGEEVGDVALIVMMAKLAAARNPEVQVFIYARWPRVAVGGKGIAFDKNDYDPGKPGSGNDLSKVDDFEERWNGRFTGGWDATNETRDYFERLLVEARKQTPGLRKPLRIVPVGHVMAEMHREMRAGRVAGWTSIYQFYKDGIHLNEPGSYLVGCTFFATLFNESPVGLASEPYGKIAPELARKIQEVAWKVVGENPAGVKE